MPASPPPSSLRLPAPSRTACLAGTAGASRPERLARAAFPRPAFLFLALLATLAASTLVAPAPAAGQGAPDPEGGWAGEIAVPGSPLAIQVEFARGDDATWSASISIPAQGAVDQPLEQVRVEGDSVGFVIPGVPGEPTFSGILSEEGDRISGTFSQGGAAFPFELRRSDGVDLSEALEGFGDWLLAQMEAWEVPGVAVAVIRGDEVAHLEGYGLRSVADSLPVTPATLFAIGSSTKSFTAALLGTLVDQGSLGWDDPVRRHLPEFALADSAAAMGITVRDLVTHRSGLPRHDALWYANPDLSREEIVARMAHLPSSQPLRAAWQYNNLAFITAGHLAERLEGASWEALVQARLLEPLGMARSNFSVRSSMADPDHARPYDRRGGALVEVDFKVIDAVGPAGSINSSAEEMAAWVRMLLAGGTLAGEPVLQRGTVEAMQTPAMALAARPTEAAFGLQAYGLGWFLDSYRGRFRVHHGGNIDGFSALVTLLPLDDLGIVVLTNRNGSPLPEFVVRQLTDRILDLEPRDWSAEALAGRDAQRARADSLAALGPEARERSEDRIEGTTPSHAPSALAGRYRHPGYGTLEVVEGAAGGEGSSGSAPGADARPNAGLTLRYYDLALPLAHVHFDVFETRNPPGETSPFGGLRVRFRTGFDGTVEAVDMALEPSLPAATFARAPDDRLTDRGFLDRLAGPYRLDTQTIRIRRQGERLVAEIPGQPPYVLVPAGETSFTLEVAPQIRVSFEVSAEGDAASVTFHQPNGTFRYERVEG